MTGTVDPTEFDDVATAVLSLVSFDALRLAADGAPVMVTITGGADHRLVWRSQMALDLYGERPVGRPVAELFPESSDAMGLWDRAFGGEQVVVPRTVVGPVDVGGRHRVLALSLGPITGADGRVVGVLQLATDITAQVDAEARAARSQLMTAITAAQADADDADAALQAVAERLVPEVADLVVVYVVNGGDSGDHALARRVAVAGVPAPAAWPSPPWWWPAR